MHNTLALPLLITLYLLVGCQPPPSYSPLPAGSSVLAFGDSVTYGTGAKRGQDYPTLLAQWSGWHVINAGIPGETTNEARRRITALLDKHQPDMVIVELGGNDFLQQRATPLIEQDLQAILETIQSRGMIAVLVAMPRPSLLGASLGVLADADLYQELASETGAVLIEGIFSDVISNAALRADRVHPNAEGYRRFTQALLTQLKDFGLSPGHEDLGSTPGPTN